MFPTLIKNTTVANVFADAKRVTDVPQVSGDGRLRAS